MKKIIAIIALILLLGIGYFIFSKKWQVDDSDIQQEESIEVSMTNRTGIEKTKENEQNVISKETIEEKKDYNVLVIGNSITLEKAGIGMAASDEYHDYYFLVKNRLEKKYDTVNMNRISAIHWEENRIISSRTDWINENLPEETVSNLDLVIFQLGDNCVPTEQFEQSATELINHVKKYSPKAKMLWVGMWFINEERLAMLPQICEKNNVQFIDISDLVVDKYKSHVGATVTSTTGEIMAIETIEEAFHPNDEGMKMIANRIIEVLNLNK